MSRTRRRHNPRMKLGEALAHKLRWDGKVRDGTPQRYSGACENHGGCPYCLGNKMHSYHRQSPIIDNELYDHLADYEESYCYICNDEAKYRYAPADTRMLFEEERLRCERCAPLDAYHPKYWNGEWEDV